MAEEPPRTKEAPEETIEREREEIKELADVREDLDEEVADDEISPEEAGFVRGYTEERKDEEDRDDI